MVDERKALSISTGDIHQYLHRQSQLCDSRIENAYLRLSNRSGESRSSASTASNRVEHRALSSLSLSAPSRKYTAVDTATRPSSAQDRRSNGSKPTEKPRGILKKTESPVANSGSRHNRSRESLDGWFQRIMHVKKLSPLDLCDVFSYGDARKHPLVPLGHVCEVLFDLDPETATGADPVTDEMEEFLYQFATEEMGEIMVNIREALRALDIWQSRVTSSAGKVDSSKIASDPQTKAAILESKNKKLKNVISSLQDANVRLSRQLESTQLTLSLKTTDELTPCAWSPRSLAAIKTSGEDVSPVKFKASTLANPLNLSRSSSTTRLQIVNLHEQELVEFASKLQFTGVKRLEQQLIEGDADSTGFVNLNQLCWILADQFELEISETKLIEVCMGMNFNSNAQLDYKEFVDVLLDILIYALPDIRESAKRKSLLRLDQYLQSGFPLGREGARQLLDTLCSKYDLKGDQCISVTELVRVFHVDLVKHHTEELPFPLEEHETIQLAHPFIRRPARGKFSAGLLPYPELLDAILGLFQPDLNPGMDYVKQSKRALEWEFWRSIYMNLCGGDTLMEQKVLGQLGKILAKLDPDATFMISTRHFKRIFERHIGSDDMAVLITALAMHEDAKWTSDDDRDDPRLRYDVLLNLVFGSPALNDKPFFKNCIRKKLLREQDRLRLHMKELTTAERPSQSLTIQDFHDIFIVQAEEHPLTTIEMLFLFATVDSNHEGSVEVKVLKNFLLKRAWKDVKRREGDSTSTSQARHATNDVESMKKLIAKCCAGYNFQRTFDGLSRKTQGWISHSAMVKELSKMLHELGVVGVHQDDLNAFVQSISQKSNGKGPSRDDIQCDAFFDALFDWDAVVNSMRLPHSLVEVKQVFEKFDWEHIGTIRCEDWNKAYRLICQDHQGMADWEVCVLQRRFPGQAHQREREQTIDYARLIVFLLDYQQRQARKTLQVHVIQHFQQQFGSVHNTTSTAEMERLFRTLDTDNKGYFNAADLKIYLTKELDHHDSSIDLLNSADALMSVMCLLAGDKSNSGLSTSVTFERFRDLASTFSSDNTKSPSNSNFGNLEGQKGLRVHPSRSQNRGPSEIYSSENDSHTISSLRAFEITILDIASEFADAKGNILPARAFRYLSLGPAPPAPDATKRTPPNSPLRRSSLSSPTKRGAALSITIRKKQNELEASTLDPLTPARLKQLLQVYHHIEVSTHLISQFFLHIGSPSKYFLDLLHFAQWAAPLSVELQVKVRGVVKQMIVKGKGGGGRLDLDRFLAQLQRRLQDSPHYMASTGSLENPPLQFVSMSLLFSKLHQLNIPLYKQEMRALLRHFGMEEDLEAVHYALFLQRLYELNSSVKSS